MEEIFQLVMHCKIPYDTAYNMPVMIRHWWFGRVEKLREEEKKKVGGGGHTDPFGRKHP